MGLRMEGEVMPESVPSKFLTAKADEAARTAAKMGINFFMGYKGYINILFYNQLKALRGNVKGFFEYRNAQKPQKKARHADAPECGNLRLFRIASELGLRTAPPLGFAEAREAKFRLPKPLRPRERALRRQSQATTAR